MAGQSLDYRGMGGRDQAGGEQSGVHSRLAVVRAGISRCMGRMLNAKLRILTYFHQTDSEIHWEAVLRR